jgi:hypothetical protein
MNVVQGSSVKSNQASYLTVDRSGRSTVPVAAVSLCFPRMLSFSFFWISFGCAVRRITSGILFNDTCSGKEHHVLGHRLTSLDAE